MRVIPNPVPTPYEPVRDAVPTEPHNTQYQQQHPQHQHQQQQLQFQIQQQQQQQHPYPAPPYHAPQQQQQQQQPAPHPAQRHVFEGGGGGAAGGMAPNPVDMAATTVVPVDEGVIGETPTQMFQTQVELRLFF